METIALLKIKISLYVIELQNLFTKMLLQDHPQDIFRNDHHSYPHQVHQCPEPIHHTRPTSLCQA